MKNIFILFLATITGFSPFAQTIDSIAIIPEPVSVKKSRGSFSLPQSITIEAPLTDQLKSTLAFLKERLSVPTGAKVSIVSRASSPTIRLLLNKTADASLRQEGYALSVTAKGIVIRANQPAGLFYGAQTFIQLFPKEIEALSRVAFTKWTAPLVEIMDYPRFGWRGLMFDVARHFFTKEDVKKFIDDMVRYKYNILHLHLTDDEGWRLQIKSLPRLTEVGAWNVKKEGYFGTFSKPLPEEPRDFGGLLYA